MPGPIHYCARRYRGGLIVLATLTLCLLLPPSGWSEESAAGRALEGGKSAGNLVMTSEAAQVRSEGQFQAMEAYLSRSRLILKSAGGHNSASFTPTLDHAGYYRIYLWWPQLAGGGEIDALVQQRNGTTRIAVDQRNRGGQWNTLGIYPLVPGSARVAIADRPGIPALVDAVRFEYLGGEAPALAIATAALPIADRGASYIAQIELAGGVAPYTWSIAQGALPSGLLLASHSGLISGAATELGRAEFTVQVRDGQAKLYERRLAIEVLAPALLPASAPVAPSTSAPATSLTLASPGKKLSVAADRVQPQDGQAATSAPDLSNLIALITALPEGEWSQLSLGPFSEAWTPADLRPLFFSSNPVPANIIRAWSSFAWDPNRGDLMLYGGGHANYTGNDIYRWRGATRRWERASLPSEVKQDDLGNWIAVDGPDAAPPSAHTYDNNIFLPLVDRLVVFGGAAFNNGGAYLRQIDATTSRRTGPYFFDPARADPNKVGGSTGSHVQRVAAHPEIVGGNMWQNRDIYVNIPGTPPLPGVHVNGCTAYAQENGKDVVYLAAWRAGGSTALDLFRYSVNAIANPAQDTIEQVGIFWNGTASQTSCGYDPTRKLFFHVGVAAIPFVAWDLNSAGPNNKDMRVTPTDPTGEFPTLLASGEVGITTCGLDFDPVRRNFALWCGGGRVWMITPPTSVSATGWIMTKQRTPSLTVPSTDTGTGILGKWKYIANLDAFIGLQDPILGNVWVYKPVGWQRPQGSINSRPTVSISSPTNGTTFVAGNPIVIQANASDSDGSIAKVEFFSGSTKLGQVLTAPYSFTWTNAPTGNAALSAVATDNGGAQTASGTINIVVQASPPAAPGRPTGVSASDGTSANSVMVAWNASANATSYSIYRSTTSGVQGGAIGTSTSSTFTDTTPTPGVTYYYSVAATGPGGSSAVSVQDSGFSLAPPPPGTGSLAGSVAASLATVNLTSQGTIDWAHWPGYDHKANGGGLISTYARVGTGVVYTYANDPRILSWSDGTPNASGSNRSGVYVTGVGNGFSLTVPASATARTLIVYVGGWYSGGRLTAHLSDGSAADYSDASLSANGQYNGVYTLTYKAASAGQQLTVRWLQSTGYGNVTLQGAALR